MNDSDVISGDNIL